VGGWPIRSVFLTGQSRALVGGNAAMGAVPTGSVHPVGGRNSVSAQVQFTWPGLSAPMISQ
jgi:hypothetical protein